MLTITWLLNDSHLHQMKMLAWYALDYLLVGTSSSPLMKRLFESGLGSSVIGNGLSGGLMQNTFAIGMKGILASNISQVEDLILQILRDIKRDGFSDDEITAALNSLEFQLREVQSGSNPAGIDVFLNALTTWNYDRLPEDAIVFDEALDLLLTTVQEQGSNFFTRMIQSDLLNNNHRVHMELHPSETIAAETIEKEKNKVKLFQNSLSQDGYNKIKDTSQELKDIQNKDDPVEVIESIPSLELSDIDRFNVEYDIDITENAFGTSTILTKNVVSGSSGIVYIDVGIDISSLGFNNVEVLPFLVAMMTENDTVRRTRSEINNFIGINTGGIDIDLKLIALQDTEQADHIATANKKMRSFLFFRGKCTAQNVGKTLELIRDLAEGSLPVTQEKAIQILEAKIASFESSVTSNGHSYSVMRMHARYNPMSLIDERLRGITQLQSLKKMLDRAQNSWDTFETRIKHVIESFSHMSSAETILNLTGDSDTLEGIQTFVETFITSLNNGSNRPPLPNFFKSDHPWIIKASQVMGKYAPVRNEGISISSRVSYVGKGGRIFDEGEIISGGLCAPLQFLRKGFLWDTVRAKNGAYGVMSSLDSTDGFLYMVSYRDPQLIKTIEAYTEAEKYMKNQIELKSITKNAIKAAIIGCIADIDGSTLPPRDIGWLSFLRHVSGSTKLRRQRWRDGVLAADVSNFETFKNKLGRWNRNSTVAVVAPLAAIEEASVGQNGMSFEIVEL
jgi:Predicted Zn-dependent peptidases, insulinase-like